MTTKKPRAKAAKQEKPKEPMPKVFIGSSVESLSVARAIQELFDHDPFECIVWETGLFELSGETLTDLLIGLETFDFGIFVFTPDDVAIIRGNRVGVARDNVLFELGLFIGALGKLRSFIVMPRNLPKEAKPLHLPTDLIGMKPGTYDWQKAENGIRSALGPVCNQMREAIKKRGRRHVAQQQETDHPPPAPIAQPVQIEALIPPTTYAPIIIYDMPGESRKAPSLQVRILHEHNTKLHRKFIHRHMNTDDSVDQWDLEVELYFIPSSNQSFQLLNHDCKLWFEIPGVIEKTLCPTPYFDKPQWANKSCLVDEPGSDMLTIYRAGKAVISASKQTSSLPIKTSYCNFSAHVFIELLPVGYSTPIVLQETLPFHKCKTDDDGWHHDPTS